MVVSCWKTWIGLLVCFAVISALLHAHGWVPRSDAIDNIGTKVDLLHYCHSHNLKVSRQM